jgi:hypothetical protein
MRSRGDAPGFPLRRKARNALGQPAPRLSLIIDASINQKSISRAVGRNPTDWLALSPSPGLYLRTRIRCRLEEARARPSSGIPAPPPLSLLMQIDIPSEPIPIGTIIYHEQVVVCGGGARLLLVGGLRLRVRDLSARGI